VKKRLHQPLLPQLIPPPRNRKPDKQKAMPQEYDPLHGKTKRKLGSKNKIDLLFMDVTQN